MRAQPKYYTIDNLIKHAQKFEYKVYGQVNRRSTEDFLGKISSVFLESNFYNYGFPHNIKLLHRSSSKISKVFSVYNSVQFSFKVSFNFPWKKKLCFDSNFLPPQFYSYFFALRYKPLIGLLLIKEKKALVSSLYLATFSSKVLCFNARSLAQLPLSKSPVFQHTSLKVMYRYLSKNHFKRYLSKFAFRFSQKYFRFWQTLISGIFIDWQSVQHNSRTSLQSYNAGLTVLFSKWEKTFRKSYRGVLQASRKNSSSSLLDLSTKNLMSPSLSSNFYTSHSTYSAFVKKSFKKQSNSVHTSSSSLDYVTSRPGRNFNNIGTKYLLNSRVGTFKQGYSLSFQAYGSEGHNYHSLVRSVSLVAKFLANSRVLSSPVKLNPSKLKISHSLKGKKDKKVTTVPRVRSTKSFFDSKNDIKIPTLTTQKWRLRADALSKLGPNSPKSKLKKKVKKAFPISKVILGASLTPSVIPFTSIRYNCSAQVPSKRRTRSTFSKNVTKFVIRQSLTSRCCLKGNLPETQRKLDQHRKQNPLVGQPFSSYTCWSFLSETSPKQGNPAAISFSPKISNSVLGPKLNNTLGINSLPSVGSRNKSSVLVIHSTESCSLCSWIALDILEPIPQAFARLYKLIKNKGRLSSKSPASAERRAFRLAPVVPSKIQESGLQALWCDREQVLRSWISRFILNTSYIVSFNQAYNLLHNLVSFDHLKHHFVSRTTLYFSRRGSSFLSTDFNSSFPTLVFSFKTRKIFPFKQKALEPAQAFILNKKRTTVRYAQRSHLKNAAKGQFNRERLTQKYGVSNKLSAKKVAFGEARLAEKAKHNLRRANQKLKGSKSEFKESIGTKFGTKPSPQNTNAKKLTFEQKQKRFFSEQREALKREKAKARRELKKLKEQAEAEARALEEKRRKALVQASIQLEFEKQKLKELLFQSVRCAEEELRLVSEDLGRSISQRRPEILLVLSLMKFSTKQVSSVEFVTRLVIEVFRRLPSRKARTQSKSRGLSRITRPTLLSKQNRPVLLKTLPLKKPTKVRTKFLASIINSKHFESKLRVKLQLTTLPLKGNVTGGSQSYLFDLNRHFNFLKQKPKTEGPLDISQQTFKFQYLSSAAKQGLLGVFKPRRRSVTKVKHLVPSRVSQRGIKRPRKKNVLVAERALKFFYALRPSSCKKPTKASKSREKRAKLPTRLNKKASRVSASYARLFKAPLLPKYASTLSFYKSVLHPLISFNSLSTMSAKGPRFCLNFSKFFSSILKTNLLLLSHRSFWFVRSTETKRSLSLQLNYSPQYSRLKLSPVSQFGVCNLFVFAFVYIREILSLLNFNIISKNINDELFRMFVLKTQNTEFNSTSKKTSLNFLKHYLSLSIVKMACKKNEVGFSSNSVSSKNVLNGLVVSRKTSQHSQNKRFHKLFVLRTAKKRIKRRTKPLLRSSRLLDKVVRSSKFTNRINTALYNPTRFPRPVLRKRQYRTFSSSFEPKLIKTLQGRFINKPSILLLSPSSRKTKYTYYTQRPKKLRRGKKKPRKKFPFRFFFRYKVWWMTRFKKKSKKNFLRRYKRFYQRRRKIPLALSNKNFKSLSLHFSTWRSYLYRRYHVQTLIDKVLTQSSLNGFLLLPKSKTSILCSTSLPLSFLELTNSGLGLTRVFKFIILHSLLQAKTFSGFTRMFLFILLRNNKAFKF